MDFGATRRTTPPHNWPATLSTFREFRHASVACPLGTRATFRTGFRACGDANGTFGRGHLFKKKDYI